MDSVHWLVDNAVEAPTKKIASRQGHCCIYLLNLPISSPPPPPPPYHQMLSASFHPHMQRRGRSRIVSPVALARQASEERRRSLTPPITDVQSGNTLPPPPQSLEDQIQVAYALDNIRLAKILLLKLKGIHITDDSDPRIDQVRDEDFDMCFAPSGPLILDEADKRALQETQRRQRQWWHESQRAQRLRACEKLWEDEKDRLHEAKLRALQRREQDALEQERFRLAEKNSATKVRPPSPLVSHHSPDAT